MEMAMRVMTFRRQGRTAEVRAFLTSFIVAEALGITIPDEVASPLAASGQYEELAILEAVRPEAISHARLMLAAIQPEDERWQQ
jgi:hypothetical protein